ncbi:MAG: hypothetical protein FWC91_12450 [Defluviitaleaceae bacterium]|nr:hypothetical protein [Defluviitaleaceae bacterium]
MRKIFLFIFIAIMIFGCARKNKVNIENTGSNTEITSIEAEIITNENIVINEVPIILMRNMESLLEEFRNILYFRENIANDFLLENSILQLRYRTIEEILFKFNINDEPSVEIRIEQNRHYPDVNDYFYYFESKNINFVLFKNEFFNEYRIITFEIMINEDNYLQLFYNLFSSISFDYFNWTLLDIDLKKVDLVDKNIIYITEDIGVWGFTRSILAFDHNGLLKSFKIRWLFS